jgi:hypothetical protein
MGLAKRLKDDGLIIERREDDKNIIVLRTENHALVLLILESEIKIAVKWIKENYHCVNTAPKWIDKFWIDNNLVLGEPLTGYYWSNWATKIKG